MTKWRGWILAILVAGGAASAFAEDGPQVRDTVVAIVNKEVITRKDVADAADPMLKSLDPKLSPDERLTAQGEIVRAVRDGLIANKLLIAEAERLAAVNEVFKARLGERVLLLIEEERRKVGGEVALREKVKEMGLTWMQYADRIRQKIMLDVVMSEFVLKDLTASPAEIAEAYEKNASRYVELGSVEYRQIIVDPAKLENDAKARALVEDIKGMLKQGHDFAALAREFSNEEKGRETPISEPLIKGAHGEPLDGILTTTPIGEAAGPVETASGYVFVKIEKRHPRRTIPFTEVQGKIEQELLIQKRTSRYDQLMKRLQSENYVEIVQ